jgi:Concanavalin A-like lectin/glucanases superfamily/Cadherin-like domain/Bacterial Ig domain
MNLPLISSELRSVRNPFRPAIQASSRWIRLLLLLVAGWLGATSTQAGSYFGRVTYNGFPVPKVQMVLQNVVVGPLTSPDGSYRQPTSTNPLRFGFTDLTASKAGYNFTSQRVLIYQLGEVTLDDINATVGPAPTIDSIGAVTLNEDSTITVNVTGIGRGDNDLPMSLSVKAVSSNPLLVPNPTVSYSSPNSTGTLTLTPAPNANGTCTITVTVTRQDNATVTRSFACTVNPVNDPPIVGPGTALALNGTNQFIDVPDGIWFGDTFTVEGWVFLRSYANWSRFFDFGNGLTTDNVMGALSLGGTGKPVFAIYRGNNGTMSQLISPQPIPVNTWTHLAFVRDSAGLGHIYINGTETINGVMNAPVSVIRTNNYFGRSGFLDNYADASFADLRIWSEARTPAQLLANRTASLSPKTPNLQLNYRFNEGSGTALYDLASSTANPNQFGAQNGTVPSGTVFLGPLFVPGNAIQLNRALNQKVVIPKFGTLPWLTGQAVTIEFWQRTDAQTNQSSFMLVNDVQTDRINAHVPWSDGSIIWDWGNILAGGRLAYTPPVSPVGQWTHFAFVADFGPLEMKIYRNGVLEASKTLTSLFTARAGDLEITPGGRMADFRIWNVQRTAEQIANSRFSAVPTNSPGLMLNLRFTETSGTTITDYAVADGAQNGTVVNGATFNPGPNADSLEGLVSQWVVPAREDNSQLINLPAADLDSTLTYTAATAQNGMLSPLGGGDFLYVPNPNFSGSDLILYTVSDGTVSRNGVVNVSVASANDPPMVGPGTSLAFDGLDDQVTLGTTGSLSGTFTVEAWVRPDDSTKPICLFGSRGPQDYGFDLKFMGGNKIHADIGNGSQWLKIDADAIFNYRVGTWYHIAYVVTPNNYAVYVNGKPVGSGTYVGIGLLYDAGHLLRLGTFDGSGEFLKGRLADVRIWNTARTADQIANNLGPGLLNNSQGLVAYYRLNEGTGLTAFDSATNDGAQNGTLNNGPTWQPADGPANAIALNGSSQYAWVGDSPQVSITGPITAEAWIYPNTVVDLDSDWSMAILEKFGPGKSGSGEVGYGMRMQASSESATDAVWRLQATFRGENLDGGSVVSRTIIQPRTWTHVAMRCDGTLLQVFVNGVLDGTALVAGFPGDGATPLYIGADKTGSAYRFNGRLGDIRLWNVARTDGEIANFRRGVPPTTPGLVLNYTFTEGSGSLLNDAATGDGSQNARLIDLPTWPGAEPRLDTLQVAKYTEDTSLQLTLPAFDIDSAALTYTNVTASSGNVSLSGNVVTYTPAPNYNGSVTISYAVSDGTTTLPGTLYLQGIPVEDGPTLDPIANQLKNEGALKDDIVLTLSDGDPESPQQAMTVTATSSNTNLIGNLKVAYSSPATNATLSYKPRPGMSGTAVITVVVTEVASRLSVTNQFNIVVAAVDDPPNVGPATALSFNGANNVNIPGISPSLPLDEVTIEFWQYTTNAATSSQSTFQLVPDDGGNRLGVQVPASDNRVYWDFGDTAAGGRLAYTPPASILGSWQHFAFVASRSGNYMKIFRNGIEEATKPGFSVLKPASRALQLGLFTGRLADFRIWNVARVGDEIQSTLHASLPNDTPGLVAYYRFNQKPAATLIDFASSSTQAGSQDGVLMADSDENDPVWKPSDPELQALEVVTVPDGSTNSLFLPAWDAENGLALTWQSVTASTGAVTRISGGLFSYLAPIGFTGPATINYSAKDSSGSNAPVTGFINLRVVAARNDAPTISVIPNQDAEENTALIEIPFSVADDQPPSNLTITPVLLANAELIQSATVPGGGGFRTLNVVPKPGVIGTVHIRLVVQDDGNKSTQTEFDLRIEPKPAFSVIDLGVLPGKAASFGTAINDRGAVGGYMTDTVDLESNPVGFFFNGLENGGVVSDNPPVQVGPSPLSSPFRVWGLNNVYTLGGGARLGGSTVAWVKGVEDEVSSKSTLPGGAYAEFRAVNDAGFLVGTGNTSAGKKRAFSFSPGGASLTELGVAPAPFNDQSEAFGLNISNHIVGAISANDGRRRAMLYQNGVMRPLFSVPDDTNSVANGINAFDQIVGQASVFAAGDSALNFDGVDDSFTQANLLSNSNGVALAAGNSAHTVEAWIQVNALPPTNSRPLLLGNPSAGAHRWQVNADGKLYIGVFGGELASSPSLPVSLGAWMHVAAAYDPASSTMAIYLNGQPYETRTLAGLDLQGIPLTLGTSSLGGTYFNGAMDEVRVWRTTRTAAQIAGSYLERLRGEETGLVVYYPMDEATGNTITSGARGALTATLNGNPARVVRGGLPAPGLTVSDSALQFDGVSSRVNLPNLPLASNSFSIEFWARLAGTNGLANYITGQGTQDNNRSLHIGFRPEGPFTFAFYGSDLQTTAHYSDTDWHHWACTFDATTMARRIYRDGIEVAADTASSKFLGTGPVMIGRAPWADNSWFKGAIDDVRFWSVARSAAEIADNRNTRLAANTPGLIAYYLFDEGGGNAAVDRVTGNSDGSLQGAISWIGRDSGASRAFLYENQSGRLRSLGTVSGGGASAANAINDFGQITGTAAKGFGQRAFFYSAGKLNDLNDLLPEEEVLDQWILETGNAINRSGAIVGTGTHNGRKRAFIALPATVIGRPVIRPQGAVEKYPQITLLKKSRSDDRIENSFYWSEGEKRLYAIRPVTAKIEWYTSENVLIGTGTNITSNTNRVVSISVNVWPRQPTIHIAGAPVDLQPTVTAANYTFQDLIYVTNRASVEPSAKVFTSPDQGYTVAWYLKNDGLPVDPSQPPYFEVIRTVPWNDSHANPTAANCVIGQEVTDPRHTEYKDKNGYVLFEKSAIDASGPDAAYNRGTRLGPILPVNLGKPGGNTNANPDDLVVVWYRTNRIGVAWASVPVRYSPFWPSDDATDRIIIASQNGSGTLDAARYPAKSIYNQPDLNLPGFNPNEEHALISADTLYAIRNDLNSVKSFSEPYTILKYRDPDTDRWRMRVFKVVAEEAPFFFTYTGTVGKEVQPPLPLSTLPLVTDSYQQPSYSQVGWKDYKGKFYARQAGPDGTHTNLVIRWFYPMQPGFFHPYDGVHVGDSIAWLDHHKANQLRAPNQNLGFEGTPIDVTYDIRWDDEPTLQIGETLIHPKRGLPDVFNMANARVIFDSLSGAQQGGGTNTLARFYDPLSARTLKTGVVIPSSLKRQNIAGKDYFPDLPWFLKIRLSYDPANNWLSFSGYLDENFGAGEPLLLPNVLTKRELDRIKKLADGDSAWADLITRLYDLTRNPNQLDINPFDGIPDKALYLGLIRDTITNFFQISGTNRTTVHVPEKVIRDPDTKEVLVRIPAHDDITLTPVSFFPLSVEDARTLDKKLSDDFSQGRFLTTNGAAPGSSYSITIGPTTTIETGPKVLTAGMGGIPAAQVKPGNTLLFDGLNGLVSLGSNQGTNLNLGGTNFTIEFWAAVNNPSKEQYLLGQASGPADWGKLRLGFRGGTFAFDLGTNSQSPALFTTSVSYTDTNWHHWAATFDSESKIQIIYRDGVQVASRTNTALRYSGFGQVELGRFGGGTNYSGTNQFFGGALDEFRVWKTVRTGAEIRAQMNKRQLGSGTEPKLEVLYRCDETAGPIGSDALPIQLGIEPGYQGSLIGGVSLVTSTAPTGIPPRYITLAENNDPTLGGLPVTLRVIRVDDGPFLGDLKVMPGDNVFDERLTLRHSSDFGGDPEPVTFQWYYKPIGADFDPTDLPIVADPTADTPGDMRNWIPYSGNQRRSGAGVNYITIGEGGESGLLTISDNAFICRYRGYAVNLNTASAWSGWVGDPSGTPDQPRAALAEGWVKRVIRGLNPFDARTSDFHSSPAVTYASMLIQAGPRYEGPIAFNPSADAINKVGLIEAYSTVLDRAKGLSIEGVPQVDFNPANNSLLLAATKISDLYTVLGNEAYADASDPTIGFGSGSKEYGSLASSIFAFQNQLDSLLDEELALLRGRDDSSAGVAARPVYNRLFWNFTLGDGEVAYQQNYNISDQDQNGFIDDKDARILYPQGHGDAWGHYLMAIKQHYQLLRHPYFTWIPRSELVNVAGVAIKVDFLDERKFANVAAAKAKAGAEIVDLTYRLNYVDDPAGQWQGYKDTKTDRAWGVDEWARRAGMGAYFDWLVGNTILPSTDPNPDHTGIDKIDRTTVKELAEIPAHYDEIQTRLDQADAGLNPLGLAKGVVPFDIDPSLVLNTSGATGKTHYEQIQDRALKAMQNALSVWDEVNKSTEALRRNQDAVEQLTANVTDQERDYKNRLIEIYGYPYAGDIGPGKTYPSGYDGPDIYHYMYVPVPDFDGNAVTSKQDAVGYFTGIKLGIKRSGDTASGAFGSSSESFWFPDDTFASDLIGGTNGLSSTNRILAVVYPQTSGRYGFTPPASYGQRQAPGELQLALSDLIQSEARLRAALKNDDALFAEIDSKVDLLSSRYHLRAETVKLGSDLSNTKISMITTIIALKGIQAKLNNAAKTTTLIADATAEAPPKAVGLATDATSFARSAIKFSGAIAVTGSTLGGAIADAASQALEKIALPTAEGIVNSKIASAQFEYDIRVQLADLERVLHQVAASKIEGIRLSEAVNQAAGRYQAALAKGQRLMEERVAFRVKTAARTTENRYQDMTFRIFRNDALQKYRATFDLAQRYVFLAATAYDYESNLLGTDTRSGRNFLTDIIRQRSLGQMLNGAPVIGRSGLADPLARMGNNFDVLKTQLGFNNPQTETGRFSLRNELFRLRDSSTEDWRAKLKTLRVSNLWDLPEFRRYCRSFAPESAGPQPGLVIRFPTTVTAGQNFFTWPLGGGDSAYDSSRFATKVRSVGVWFSGYNGLGLSQTPRVYLIPAGADVLSSPTPNDFVTRGWRVVDQALPVPFPIGANRLKEPSWIPINDSLGGSFAEVRRFSSFRAYHDSGGFSPSEVTSDSRLIGRSVWNTDWVLIIPGQTFLSNGNTGIDSFINSISDIKLFFQTYSYSGN